jgi:Family of unknown function (DUF6370)
MKKSVLLSVLTGVLLLALASPSLVSAKDMTITGEAKCTKCSLKETEKCGTVIEAEGKNGKTVKYYLVDNDVSKAFHESICKEGKKVTATGSVEKVGDKREFTATKIDLVK